MKTTPWFYYGLFPDIDGLMNMYNVHVFLQRMGPRQENHPLLAKNDKLIKGSILNKMGKDAVFSFLAPVTSPTILVSVEKLPQ